ncbi:MAG: NADH-quinone oxidoreductase subunit H [Candidatus Omnitrophica bacterium]|nr:NADH-quinone oxidoreductase subunit H [Candidatus Omnitrophota bacterium]
MAQIPLLLIQTAFIIALAPLVSGFIRKLKDILRMRRGASIFQPYYNFAKLLKKDEVVSRNSSWIFAAAPVVVLASSVAACLLLPVSGIRVSAGVMGDMLALFFILALGRFFLALAGLDTASAFGGMGSSREMFISSILEPAAFVSLFVLSMNCGSTAAAALAGTQALRASTVVAGAAFFMVVLAETSRIPVDNRETHLELTMVHEAMVLEYSGRPLALIELAGHIKQAVLFVILGWFFFPAAAGFSWRALAFFAGMSVTGLAIALIEISLAKMRLFRVVDFGSFAFFIALLAAVFASMGM